MTTPFLGGLGAALQSLGQQSTQNSYLQQLQDERNKQLQLQQLAMMNTIGGRPLQPGEDPDQAIQSIVNNNTTVQQESGHGAVPNTAIGGTQKPYIAPANPYTTSIGNQQILVNPANSTAYQSDQRYMAGQQSLQDREDARIAAQNAREDAQNKAKADLEDKKLQAGGKAAFALLPDGDPLKVAGYDPTQASEYVRHEQELEHREDIRLQGQNAVNTAQARPQPVVPVVNPGGETTYSTVGNAPGQVVGAKPTAPKAAGANAQQMKDASQVALMGQSIGTMEQLAARVNPAHITAAVKFPTAANPGLTQEEQTYLNAARNFLPGVLHLESGARLNADQWGIGLQRFFPAWGDTPQTILQKTQAARKVYEDRKALLSGGQPQAAPQAAPASKNPFLPEGNEE